MIVCFVIVCLTIHIKYKFLSCFFIVPHYFSHFRYHLFYFSVVLLNYFCTPQSFSSSSHHNTWNASTTNAAHCYWHTVVLVVFFYWRDVLCMVSRCLQWLVECRLYECVLCAIRCCCVLFVLPTASLLLLCVWRVRLTQRSIGQGLHNPTSSHHPPILLSTRSWCSA